MNVELVNGEAPIFNIKAVVNQTGLNPATIRAWERRYGLPSPQRTEGGHRQYSQRDIDTLKWLIARQDEGISISRAIKLWKTSLERGEDPLEPEQGEKSDVPVMFDPSFSGDQIEELRHAWIAACLAFDRETAEHVLARAFALFSPESVCFEILQKALVEIGDGWHRGEVTVQQEHFTSALSIQRVETLIASAPPATRNEKIVIANAPNDYHTFSTLLLTYFIRRSGWDVVYLGANVPGEEIELMIQQIKPDLVIISAQLLTSAASLAKIARALQDQSVHIAYGGGVFNQTPSLRQRIPGHFLGTDLKNAPQEIAKILREKSEMPQAPSPAAEYEATLTEFMDSRPFIEAQVLNAFTVSGMQRSDLMGVNNYFAQDIIAALTIGDLELIYPNFYWVAQLLENNDIPQESLNYYLQAYHAAAQVYLDPSGLLVNWLAQVTSLSPEG